MFYWMPGEPSQTVAIKLNAHIALVIITYRLVANFNSQEFSVQNCIAYFIRKSVYQGMYALYINVRITPQLKGRHSTNNTTELPSVPDSERQSRTVGNIPLSWNTTDVTHIASARKTFSCIKRWLLIGCSQ